MLKAKKRNDVFKIREIAAKSEFTYSLVFLDWEQKFLLYFADFLDKLFKIIAAFSLYYQTLCS